MFTGHFTASDTLPQEGWMIFANDGGTQDSLAMSGRGVHTDLLISRSVIDFGTLEAGHSRVDSFMIFNRSVRVANVSTVRVNDQSFSVTPDGANILPSESETFVVTFAPTSAAQYSAPLVVSHNLSGSPDTIMLEGTATITSVAAGETPGEFVLAQNYPNPFGTITTLAFTLQHSDHIVVTLCDIEGAEIATLVNGMYDRGPHAITWNASAVPAGTYVVKLATPGETVSRVVEVVR
jgi:hypothetical protein